LPLLTEIKAVNETEYCCTVRYRKYQKLSRSAWKMLWSIMLLFRKKKKKKPKQILIAKAKNPTKI